VAILVHTEPCARLWDEEARRADGGDR
jgi:hypothetical protein